VFILGGKSHEGYPLITLPDTNNFSDLQDRDYQKLMLYLTSVPSMQEADMGFAVVIDRRNDKWSSVKSALLKLSGYFPGLVHIAFVIRPSGFLQKAISEFSNKLFKEEFKFKVVICSCVEELHQYLDRKELTTELDGTMPYCHQQWIQQRIALEHFSRQMKTVSRSLDCFTLRLKGSSEGLETENDSTSLAIRGMLSSQTSDYSALKEEILRASRRGDDLLADIRQRLTTNNNEPSSLVNITAVERLLVQLEETERTFDDFWQQHSARLRQCLDLQKFYTDFKRLQSNLESHLKAVSQSTEIGETVQRVEYLIKEFNSFQKHCICDIERSEELVSMGENITRGRHYWPIECVAVRCEELQRMCLALRDRLEQRSDTLAKSHQLQVTVDKANRWCARGIELLGARHIENCSCALDAAEKSLTELQGFTVDAEQFHSLLVEYSTPETKALVSQVLQRIEDVKTMCNKKITTLRRLVEKPPRPVQTVTPEPGIPLQPALRPTPLTIRSKDEEDGIFKSKESAIEKEQETKRGHVLTELLETERVYVSELGSIIQGYKKPMLSDEMREMVPQELEGKGDIIFGNLEDIYCFHGDIFLQDLENCISTTELVALCFTHRRDAFHRLYSAYCQNIPRSERLRTSLGENSFFRTCQARLGHKLPLAAYLLKPVQRITKYQLLLKDLLSHSEGQKWCSELQEALECMLVVLKCVNDSMHQTAITGYWDELSDLGELLMQGDFSVWSECKKDRLKELRLKPMQRHLFLYQKAILFCKKSSVHNKTTYHFKRLLKMSEIGLTETVRCDGKTFEVWLGGRSEVHTIQAASPTEKNSWVEQIKNLLLHQLAQLKIKQYSGRWLRQAMSLDSGHTKSGVRSLSCDEARAKPSPSDDDLASSSDISNSEDEETFSSQVSSVTTHKRYNKKTNT
ncbi:hypothetical protein AAG570_002744, partial [Ranatra chinensis]